MAARSGAPYEMSAAGDLHRRPARLRGPKGTEKRLRLAPAAGLLLTTTLCLAPTPVLGQSSAPTVAAEASSPGGTETAQANLDAATEAFLAARAAEERAREALRSAASEAEERATQAALERARSALAYAQEQLDQAQSALGEARLTPEQRQRRAQLEAGASTAAVLDAPLTPSPARPARRRLQTVERVPAAQPTNLCVDPSPEQPSYEETAAEREYREMAAEAAALSVTIPQLQASQEALQEQFAEAQRRLRAQQRIWPDANVVAATNPEEVNTLERQRGRVLLELYNRVLDLNSEIDRAAQELLVARGRLRQLEAWLAQGPPEPRQIEEERVQAPCPESGPATVQSIMPVIWLGTGRTDAPTAGIGFTRPGGPGTTEFAAAETPDELTTRTYGAGLQLTVGGVPANLSFHYGEGSGTTAFSIDPGPGGDTGIVYGGLSPGGSSGIAAPFASSGSIVVDYQRFGARVEVPVGPLFAGFAPPAIDVSGYSGAQAPPVAPQASFTPIVYLGVEDVSYDYFGLLRSGSLGGLEFGQERDQRLHDTMIDVGVGGDLRVPLGGPFSLHASGRAGPYWLRSRLRSTETNSNNFTGPPDGSFTLAFRERDSSIGFHGAVAAGLEILLARDIALGASGSANYRSRTGTVFNPGSGDQVFFEGLTTTLARDSSWSYGAQVGIRIGLGRR